LALTTALGRAAGKPTARPGRAGSSRRRRVSTTPYLFLLPGIAVFVVAIIWPAVSAFQMSLYKWNVFNSSLSRWSGIDNYVRAFQDPHFWLSLSNSGIYMLATVIPQIVLGLGIALLLKRKSPSQPLFRVLFYLPVVTSWVVVSLLFKYLFDDSGLINFTLHDFVHLEASNTSWLADRWSALVVICLLGIWKGIGWSMMIYLAALQGVPESLEEAAEMDGANRWQRFRVVTLPAINPATVFISVMLVIGGLNVFTSVQLITNGGPIGQTDVVLTYMYTQAFKYSDFGYASSIAVLLAVLVFILAVVQLRVMRRDDTEELS
jgi:multiple sugar transport system permease protein